MEKLDFSKAYVAQPGIAGGMPEKMVVSDGYNGYDMRKAIASEIMEGGFTIRKALSTTLSTYAAGTLPVLIPVYIDPEMNIAQLDYIAE